jgi:hypothetical protein
VLNIIPQSQVNINSRAQPHLWSYFDHASQLYFEDSGHLAQVAHAPVTQLQRHQTAVALYLAGCVTMLHHMVQQQVITKDDVKLVAPCQQHRKEHS